MKECIARRLKEARLIFGISQKKLGMLAGIDEQSASARMNQYEMGRNIPNFLTLQHIGTVLGYPLEYFFAEDDMVAEIIYLVGRLSGSNKKKVLDMARALSVNGEKKKMPVQEI